MSLEICIVKEDFQDLEKLNSLNSEAFPSCERVEITKLIELAKLGSLDICALYDNQLLVGFFVIFFDKQSAYLTFLAIDPKQRSQGYGSQALQLIANKYKNLQILIDIEKIEEKADNYQQRLKRKNFYLRNNCHESGYMMSYLGMDFELLELGNNFEPKAFRALLEKLKVAVSELSDVSIEFKLYKK